MAIVCLKRNEMGLYNIARPFSIYVKREGSDSIIITFLGTHRCFLKTHLIVHVRNQDAEEGCLHLLPPDSVPEAHKVQME